jgi:Flp pilus assembly protein TadD
LQRNAFVRARDERLAALRFGADTADGGLALGTALEDFGDLAGARAAYERALGVDPRHSPVALNLGLVRAKLGDRDGARVALSQALGSDPNSGAAHFALGLWHAEAGQTEQAERLLERAVQLDPAFPRARLNLALLYWQTDRPALAEPLLRAEWNERPTREVCDTLAALLERTERAAEAQALRAIDIER